MVLARKSIGVVCLRVIEAESDHGNHNLECKLNSRLKILWLRDERSV